MHDYHLRAEAVPLSFKLQRVEVEGTEDTAPRESSQRGCGTVSTEPAVVLSGRCTKDEPMLPHPVLANKSNRTVRFSSQDERRQPFAPSTYQLSAANKYIPQVIQQAKLLQASIRDQEER